MNGWQYVVINLLGAACVVVAGFALVTQQQAESLQQQVAGRQKQIERGVEMSRVNTRLIKVLATEALDSGDQRLGRILSDQGISFSAAGGRGTDG